MGSDREIRQLIRRAAKDTRIPCKKLLELAARSGTPPKRIGRLCDELGIRISNCQLGCFR